MSRKKELSLSVGQIIRLYWSYASRYKLLIVGLLAAAVTGTLFMRFLPPLVIANVLDKLSAGNYTSDIWASFGGDIITYAAFSLIGGVVLWRLAVIFLWKLELLVVRDMHQDIFNQLMILDAKFHANRFTGSIVSQANKFTGAYVRVIDTTVFDLSGLILSFIFTAIILLPRAPYVVLFLVLFSIAFMYISIKITGRVRELNAVEAAVSNKQTGFLADMVTNIMAVKSYAAQKYENKRYAEATNNTVDAGTNLMLASAKRDVFFGTSTSLLSIGALVIAIASVSLWSASIATVFLVVQYTAHIANELWGFGRSTLRNYNRAFGDAQEMTEILSMTPEVQDVTSPKPLDVTSGEITFANVGFTHDGADEAIFEDFSLTIKPGEKVGVVGHSGSGKTTFTRLLLRFSDVTDGTISIDNQNIANVSQSDLHAAISYVPQEPMLFHRSLAENIAYGDPTASHERVVAAARQANTLEFIEKLPQGFETLVGERGVKLSGGQRQRIAIARAILKDAPILVLDEATSALDSESEKLIQESLETLMKGRTSIVIAHRLSTIAKLDRIIVLDNGAIIEDGSHAELLKKKGTYAKLWSHQSGGFIEE